MNYDSIVCNVKAYWSCIVKVTWNVHLHGKQSMGLNYFPHCNGARPYDDKHSRKIDHGYISWEDININIQYSY